MISFSALMSRVEETILQKILGCNAIGILNALDDSKAYNKRLKQLVLEVYSGQDLIRDREVRNELIDLLKTHEVRELYSHLGFNDNISNWSDDKVYNNLKEKNITVGSNREKKLFSFFDLAIENEDKIVDIEESLKTIMPQYPLFPHQRASIKKVQCMLNEEPFRVLLHMPTGAGKTRTAMNIIVDHMRSLEPTLVIWLANSEELCQQALEEMKRAWGVLGNREIGIYCLWGNAEIDISDMQTKDCVIVASMAKLNNKITKGEISFISTLGSRVSLVIIDEAHQALAPTYKRVMDNLCNIGLQSKLLGLSATPGRTWNNVDEDMKLAELFSKKKVKLEISGYENPVDYLVDKGYLAKAIFRNLEYKSTGNFLLNKDILDIPDKILKMLGEDARRNLTIIYEVERLVARGNRRILVFAPSVKCSNLLAVLLRARGLDAVSITGETLQYARSEGIRHYKEDSEEPRILCNFGVLTTGFDAPKTSAAVIARPTYSLVLFSQMVGRAIRGELAGGNKEAEIVTIVDTNLPGFDSVANAFENWEDVWE